MNKIIKSAVGLIIVTALSKIVGFFREIVLASIYGATSLTDSYIIATSIPNAVFSVIGIALTTTFIPIFYEIDSSEGKDESNNFTNNILNICIILSILIAMLVTIFAEPVVRIFASGFTGETLNLTIELTRISIWGIVLMSINSVIKSYLNSKNNFVIPGIVGLPYNLIMILSIVLSFNINNIYVLIYGFILGILSQSIVQVFSIIKLGFTYKLNLNIKDLYLKKMMKLLLPVIIGVSVDQVNTIIDKTLASTLTNGSISALNYSNKLVSLITIMFISSVSSVIYPVLSKLSTENNKEKYAKSIVQIVNSIVLLVVPISIGAMVLSKPIVKLLFERGAFTPNATKMTSIALVFYSIGMVAFGLRDILGRVFYSLQDTKTPMVNGAISMVMNIIFNLILIKPMGHSGLALGTSMSSMICILLLFNSLKKKIGYFGQDKIINTGLKSLFSAIVMGIITYFIYNILTNVLGIGFVSDLVSLSVAIGVGVAVYSILIIMLKIEEVGIIINIIRKKFKW